VRFFNVFHEIFPKYREGNQYRVTAASALKPCLASNTKKINFSFIFFKNNQPQNILVVFHFLYHINIFFITIQIKKKFTTIQNFFTFLYKLFLLYFTSIIFY
jgi:hypothetical protein